MKAKKISKTTTNRGEFNRAYKEYLERKGRIHCSRCRYHKGENYTGNCYGGFEKTDGHTRLTYPNWKLVSKHPKQWMEKPMRIDTRISNRGTRWESTYVQIKF
jgi:hypothetical protein